MNKLVYIVEKDRVISENKRLSKMLKKALETKNPSEAGLYLGQAKGIHIALRNMKLLDEINAKAADEICHIESKINYNLKERQRIRP